MRVIIFGAGTIGTWIAELLCQHKHSVTIVDTNPEHIARLNEALDVRGICGSAAESSIHFQAGVLGADVCLAVTGSDEVNIVAASMSKAMGARRCISRVYAPIFRDLSTFDYQRHFHIDRMLSLEHLSAVELARSIHNPGSVVMEQFARGALEVQDIVIANNAKVLGKPLKEIQLSASVRIGSILRDEKMWIAGAEDKLKQGDRITLIGRHEDIQENYDLFVRGRTQKQTIAIGGGGETGYHLAQALSAEKHKILLLEQDRSRCEFLAAHLPKHATVLHVDATRRQVLEEERIPLADVYVACTGDDENNIMAGVEAHDLGVPSIMAIVSRPDYASIVNKLGINVAVSPREVMAKEILGFLNEGAVISKTSLPGGNIGVFELEVRENTRATQMSLANLPLPKQCLIAAVLQEDFVHVPGADDRLKEGQRVIALIDEDYLFDVEQLFNS
ncbi:MAG: Trk system potassium transporter TrkA [Pirellulaceae bacterium]|nr:Trk system potassium transporter TrkA [Pirellulaceae bacterium]